MQETTGGETVRSGAGGTGRMKQRDMWSPVIACVVAATSVAAQTSISVRDEIRYPTSWREQRIDGGVDARYRTPIPVAFKTRETGVHHDVAAVGVVRQPVMVRNRPPLYQVVFSDGREARIAEGQVTIVGGVPYRGLGVRDGYFQVMNLRTLEILRFRMPGAGGT